MQPILVPDLRVGETAREEIGMTGGGKKKEGWKIQLLLPVLGGKTGKNRQLPLCKGSA